MSLLGLLQPVASTYVSDEVLENPWLFLLHHLCQVLHQCLRFSSLTPSSSRLVNPEGEVGGRLEKNWDEALGLLDDLGRGGKAVLRGEKGVTAFHSSW